MTQQEAQALYAVLLRLVDQDQTLTPMERRDILNQIVHARCEQTVDDILAATANQRRLRIKRGTTAENDAYTGLSGEITLDTDENTLRVHDGQTPGGHMVTAGGGTGTGSIYVPDYEAPVAITGITTTNTEITLPSDGVVVIKYNMCNGGEIFYIDDKMVFSVRDFAQSLWEYLSAPIPVAAGTHTMRTSYSAARIASVTFYPFL